MNQDQLSLKQIYFLLQSYDWKQNLIFTKHDFVKVADDRAQLSKMANFWQLHFNSTILS